jgi:hypothetical protein
MGAPPGKAKKYLEEDMRLHHIVMVGLNRAPKPMKNLFLPKFIGNKVKIPKYSLGILLKASSSLVVDTILGEPKSFQVEDDKITVEASSYTIHW